MVRRKTISWNSFFSFLLLRQLRNGNFYLKEKKEKRCPAKSWRNPFSSGFGRVIGVLEAVPPFFMAPFLFNIRYCIVFFFQICFFFPNFLVSISFLPRNRSEQQSTTTTTTAAAAAAAATTTTTITTTTTTKRATMIRMPKKKKKTYQWNFITRSTTSAAAHVAPRSCTSLRMHANEARPECTSPSDRGEIWGQSWPRLRPARTVDSFRVSATAHAPDSCCVAKLQNDTRSFFFFCFFLFCCCFHFIYRDGRPMA